MPRNLSEEATSRQYRGGPAVWKMSVCSCSAPIYLCGVHRGSTFIVCQMLRRGSFYSRRQNPKSALAFSSQALRKTVNTPPTRSPVLHLFSFCCCIQKKMQFLWSTRIPMALETKTAWLQEQCRWFFIRAFAIYLHAKRTQNESLMNARLGFIQPSQSRTFLFALLSSDETNCIRKNNALGGGESPKLYRGMPWKAREMNWPVPSAQ